MTYRIYLSGPIAGLTFDNATDWRATVADELEDTYDVEVLDPMRDKFAEPDTIITNPSKVEAVDPTILTDIGVVVRDHIDTVRADILIVNFLGATAKSIGTAMEMAWAWDRQIPIVLAIETAGNPNDHPFIRTTASFRVDSIERAIVVARSVLGLRPMWEIG